MKQKIICLGEAQKRHAIELINGLTGEEIHQVTISPFKRSRKEEQNALYWVWMAEASRFWLEAIGEAISDEDIHEEMKRLFLETKTYSFNGEIRRRPKSTRKLNVKEFSEYLEKIAWYWAENGLELRSIRNDLINWG